MDEKTIMEALKDRAADIEGIEVHDWPWEGDAAFFYVETEDHRRFSAHVEEFSRFQEGGHVHF